MASANEPIVIPACFRGAQTVSAKYQFEFGEPTFDAGGIVIRTGPPLSSIAIYHWFVFAISAMFYGVVTWAYRKRGTVIDADE